MIEATNSEPNRPPDLVEIEARAQVCGVSWVYQRVGRIDEAVAAAKKSEELNAKIHNRLGLAYDHKCLGNLYRRTRDHTHAEKLLQKAALEFTEHKGPGDRSRHWRVLDEPRSPIL